jgi:uncharacterized protein
VPELPMFPLGTALLPHALLPLHVFEPRYRALVQDVIDGDREFGVVLIRRGHEVGGGDERTDVGTVARVLQAEELEDGRWITVTLGTRRLRVERWLPDDPYPRAEVRILAEAGTGDPEFGALFDRLEPRVRRILGMQAELGEEAVPVAVELDPDPLIASWQLAVISQLPPFDAQRLLELDDAASRLRLLSELLDDREATLAFRLGTDDRS